LLQANLADAYGRDQAPAVIRTSRRREDTPENVLEQQILDFLRWRGFISHRMHVGLFTPYRIFKQMQAGQLAPEAVAHNVICIGEKGMADWLSIRQIIPAGGRAQDGPWPWTGFYWEAKSPGKRPSDAQLEWLAQRRAVGLSAAWFNQFSFRDRPAPVVEARESPVFEVWFYGYFAKESGAR
jgi:hypothetical protein